MAQTLHTEGTSSLHKGTSPSWSLSQLPSFVEEAPEFLDPFSDINLFLSQKLQHCLQSVGFPKRWNPKLENELLAEIAPEFSKRFPKYRLSICALKKAWERVHIFLSAIREEKRALTQDGKVDLLFLIRENLRHFPPSQGIGLLRPYHYAYELALKVGECIATIDSIRPNLEDLTKLIWAVAKNLIPAAPRKLKSPYDEDEPLDLFLARSVAFQLTRCPTKGANEIEVDVRDAIHLLHELPSIPLLRTTISALLAERLMPESTLQTLFSPTAYGALSRLTRLTLTLCRAAHPQATHADHVRRSTTLLQLASQLPKGLPHELVKEAILKSYPTTHESRPDLPQSLYAFIAAVGILMQTEECCHCPAFVVETINRALNDADLLPDLKGRLDEIELFIWKILAKEEKLLDTLPFKLGAHIEEEIAHQRIDHPNLPFASLTERVVQSFTRMKLVTRARRDTIERKIKSACLQGEMTFRWLKEDVETPLFNIVETYWKKKQDAGETLTSTIVQHYLSLYPHLAPYTPHIALRIQMHLKTLLYGDESTSAYHLFLKMRMKELKTLLPHLTHEELLQRLEEHTARLVPLLPFQRDDVSRLLSLKEEQEDAHREEGQTQILAHC